ncbi:hypothetical protein HBA55_36890 [Pseudomaricurvus alkylphenolicus]|uniref:hypothetical protein n=1 Tax=Pseudomaricurvus alkylphenolicus TaxID=1306991 RepID=UPI0014213C70|nr:hypothetical protein [Pseudomaricurvus alkylphenolicus]NIB45209.1 hypothetical protein [Pseudomaricurvus alkylphenolicus]
MKNFALSMLFLSAHAVASGGPEIVALTHSSANELGFTVVTKLEGPSTQVQLKGPAKSIDSCPASRSGTFLLDAKGQELMVHITELPPSQEQPEALGYYIDKNHTMGVFIDYLCSQGSVTKSKRYTVPSISNWLITRPSN